MFNENETEGIFKHKSGNPPINAKNTEYNINPTSAKPSPILNTPQAGSGSESGSYSESESVSGSESEAGSGAGAETEGAGARAGSTYINDLISIDERKKRIRELAELESIETKKKKNFLLK